MRKVAVLLLGVVLSLTAELWVNAIRDPGAELGQGDWVVDSTGWPEGATDSCRVNAHDSTRAYAGGFSFLTDTQKDVGLAGNVAVEVWCKQTLPISKSVSDIDSCSWFIFLNKGNQSQMQAFHIYFRSQSKQVWFHPDIGGPSLSDTLYPVEFPTPDSGEWTQCRYDLNDIWVNTAGWSPNDSLTEIGMYSSAWHGIFWSGQEISWDNIVLRSFAYYDYASESIDSDPWSETPRSYTPIATFSNKGKLDDFSTWVFAEIYRHGAGDIVFTDSAEVSIPSDGSEQVTFETYQHEPDDAGYTLRVFPLLENDEYTEDDTLELVLAESSIEEEPAEDLALSTRIVGDKVYFTLPEGVTGELSIYDATGRRIEHLAVTGAGSTTIPALHSGVYFIRLDARLDAGHSVLTEKVVVAR